MFEGTLPETNMHKAPKKKSLESTRKCWVFLVQKGWRYYFGGGAAFVRVKLFFRERNHPYVQKTKRSLVLLQKKGVSKNNGTPKSSILRGFSITNHPFWGYPYFRKHPEIQRVFFWLVNFPPFCGCVFPLNPAKELVYIVIVGCSNDIVAHPWGRWSSREQCWFHPGWLFDIGDEKLPNYMGVIS